jgi:hypothetical protein
MLLLQFPEVFTTTGDFAGWPKQDVDTTTTAELASMY